MAAGATKQKLRNFVDNLPGDKVVWMIAILLIMFSIVSVFSSTSLLAQQKSIDRMSIVKTQMIVAAVGLGIISLLCAIKHIGIFRFLAQFGFIVSFAMLLCLVMRITTPFFRAASINNAWRILIVFGVQIHVYEVVKLAMVMYLAWAVNALKDDRFAIANFLSNKYKRLSFLGKSVWKKLIYIYLPILSICVLMLEGGTSSTLFFALIMFLIIFVGGVRLREVFILAAAVCAYVAMVFLLWRASDGKVVLSTRIVSAIGRVDDSSAKDMDIIMNAPRNSNEFQDALDRERQPVSALIAIKEGRLFGKGPGRSTQRYVVPVMFGDYMFSFIIEEYGLIGAIILIILYASLMARGAIIVKSCDNYFAKVAVAGLILLVSGQAFMHMAINVHLAPQTGQTLPLISHGTSSFLVFCTVFGIILSISRMAREKILLKEEEAGTLSLRRDEVQESLTDLEEFDDIENQESHI